MCSIINISVKVAQLAACATDKPKVPVMESCSSGVMPSQDDNSLNKLNSKIMCN